MRRRSLKCCCCGNDAGIFKQWWNRDTGYGVCRRCVDDEIALGTSPEQIRSNYGVEGVNYAGPPAPQKPSA